MIRSGAMEMVTGRALPRGFGMDFAGVVEAAGTDVARLRVGDEMLGGTSPRGPVYFVTRPSEHARGPPAL
ncbi:alcohol dehydrogenase catalytic domain-containing protein [Nocardia carnea]|uniref:alcohol dehydrogenase catalytic domain-containing protein n=1 Tax=Nocardia carnea TaxID=37328 RepID=UPI003D770373